MPCSIHMIAREGCPDCEANGIGYTVRRFRPCADHVIAREGCDACMGTYQQGRRIEGKDTMTEYPSSDGNCEHVKNGCYCTCPHADWYANDDGTRAPRNLHPEGCMCACDCHPVCTCGDVHPDRVDQLAAMIERVESDDGLAWPEVKKLQMRVKHLKKELGL